MRKFSLGLIAVMLSLSLSGCGQKGPLFIPGKPAPSHPTQ